MTSYTTPTTNTSYVYRADGMRVSKTVTPSYFPATGTTYSYDGQLGFEDVDAASSGITVTDYGLGAKGIDYIASTTGSGTTVGFPVYDAHGNMTACLFRSGTTSFSVGNQRHYDAWGLIRSGAGSGDPKGRYCAALGHKQDDESGLVYMRARYYEPISGRFVSQDSRKSGLNWFAYASSSPVNFVDGDGHSIDSWPTENVENFDGNLIFALFLTICAYAVLPQVPGPFSDFRGSGWVLAVLLLTGAAGVLANAFGCPPGSSLALANVLTGATTLAGIIGGVATSIAASKDMIPECQTVVMAMSLYSLALVGILADIEIGS